MNPAAWLETPLPPFPALDRDLSVDLIVVGGGMTGITTAYLAKRAGFTVALLERDRCAGGDTSRTTAHLTAVTDLRLFEIEKTFGKQAARAVWDAGRVAIDQIATNICDEGIDCDFQWKPGFLHSKLIEPNDEDRRLLQKEYAFAQDLGIETTYLPSIPLFGVTGVRFDHQASFHPRKYLRALIERIPGGGCHVFEHTKIETGAEEPLWVEANGHRVSGKMIFVATHDPITGVASTFKAMLEQTKLARYNSYVIGARAPRGSLPVGLYWDLDDPYFYTRVDTYPEFDYVIFGGCDHKTGQEHDTTKPYHQLEELLISLIPEARVDYRWSGQIMETNDGLPFIGEEVPGQFIATGFSGNGMTFGTLAARMAVDRLAGRPNPWADLFDANRAKIRGGTWSYITENLDYPYHLVRDRIARTEGASLNELGPGQGKILGLDGKKVAAYRDDGGQVTLLSPVCTHLKCIVNWNKAEKTWDCPCHGARFSPKGQVISGPAEQPLEPLDAKAAERIIAG